MITNTDKADFIDGQSILITGGTGSFGKQFVKTVLKQHNPKKLIIFSRDEYKQYKMQEELAPLDKKGVLRFFLGDVRDVQRLYLALRNVDTVIHAAALKQVTTAEYNPFEFIHTNVNGAENLVHACLRNEVKRLVALSTDKAANPINLYGASKLASDKIFVAANNVSGDLGTRFAVVRYGNVMGSRGSVMPLFKKLISEGADALPITDERMTRFWITLPQGVDFVLSSLQIMQGAEIFVPKIPSMKVTDLAKVMAPDLPHKVIGIRPGEKLHEVMITEDDARNTVEIEDRYIIKPGFIFTEEAKNLYADAPRVNSDFRYASNTNPEWMSAEDLKKTMQELDLI